MSKNNYIHERIVEILKEVDLGMGICRPDEIMGFGLPEEILVTMLEPFRLSVDNDEMWRTTSRMYPADFLYIVIRQLVRTNGYKCIDMEKACELANNGSVLEMAKFMKDSLLVLGLGQDTPDYVNESRLDIDLFEELRGLMIYAIVNYAR